MRPSLKARETAKPYLFRFDAPMPRRVFGERYDLSGWLLHSSGEPVTGIRAVLRRPLARRQVFSARRKRSRPDIASAFPNLAEAKTSGFLVELRLRLGRNQLTLQVRDEERVWHTIHTAVIYALPLLLLDKIRFPRLRQFLIAYLQRRYVGAPRIQRAESGESSVTLVRMSPVKRVDLFATTKSNLFILEIGQLLAAGFKELGCDARLLLDQIPVRHPPPDTLQIVVTPHEYYNLFLSNRLTQEEAAKVTQNVVLYCTEQPDTGWFHNNLPWATRSRAVADINSLGAMAYHDRGIRSYYFGLGYHELLEATPVTLDARELDVSFLGSITPRREQFFAEHALFFAAHRCHLRFVPLGFAKTKITKSYLSPESRNELLCKSKLLLNVHYSERPYFEWHRALVGLANGCCVISEKSEGYGRLVPGRHFIMADREDLVACCEYYLANPGEAAAIADEGHNFVKTCLRQAQACQAFLDALERSDGRAPVVGDARAEPLPPRLVRSLADENLQRFKNAITEDFQHLRSRSHRAVTVTAEEQESPTRESVIERREAYAARLSEQEGKLAEGTEPWEYYDNMLYRSSVDPRLAVVVTLFNYAGHIRECLRSIEHAANCLTFPPEIIIVDDASTDNSLAEARACQEDSNLPMRIVNKRYNTGLADARNIGTNIARAPYVFMMDADNLVLDNCLVELLDIMERNSCAAAYSLLCRFRGAISNRVGLLSYYDWDPQILVQQPYIDAMAMFRRDALLELGGYDNQLSQIGWFGWEDYDMWLRFAQKDLAVAFVPNILCLYRQHERSMISLTNLFEPELVQHLLDRYRDLVARFEPRETLFGVERSKTRSFPFE